ncbi:MAG: VanZ family protein [Blautia sp.]|jgi:glycopeptide antibiotics resistance protein
MNYLRNILPMLPVAAIAALAVCKLSGSLRKKSLIKEKGIGRALAVYLLIGWGFLFFYVTLLLSLGNGMGEAVNLKPLRPFAVAARYGTVNAPMVEQFWLNMAMFVPLGVLLPAVSVRCGKFWQTSVVSFVVSAVTECLQFFIKRGADIDDVIANTLGGMLGYGLFVLGTGFWLLWKWRQNPCEGAVHRSVRRQALRSILSVLGILFLAASVIGLHYADTRHIYGTFYYGHLRPGKVEIPEGTSETSFLSPIYLYEEEEDVEELMDRLKERTGFAGEFEEKGDTWTLKDGDRQRIFVYPWNRWRICWNYGVKHTADPKLIPLEKDAKEAADVLLHRLGLEELKYVESLAGYEDGNLHLAYERRDQKEEQGKMAWGRCVVTVGENGHVLEVDSSIVTCKFVTRESTISPKQAAKTAGDVGVGRWSGKAVVETVEPTWYFHEDTGYLTPAWKIIGVMHTESKETYPWEPVIDGIQ